MFVQLGAMYVPMLGAISRFLEIAPSMGTYIASRLLQVSSLQSIWIQPEPELVPSWLKMSPCWCQASSNLEAIYVPMLGAISRFPEIAPSMGTYIASRLLQVSLAQSIWIQPEPKLAPSWLKMIPCWRQAGSNLA